MRPTHSRLLLLCILIIAATLRFYKLGVIPASMNTDEVAIGYNAYSILKTGKDEYGRKFPLLFQSFDDYKLPAYIYFTVPSVAVFGLHDVSVRLPSAFFGTLTVLATYFFVEALFVNPEIALLSALLLAVSPWHLQFSRSAYEANLAVFFTVVGTTCLLRSLKRSAWYIPGFLLLALSVWSYHSSRIFIPLILVGFVALYFREILKSKLTFSIGIILCIGICMPLFLLSISSSGLVRAKGVSAMDDPGLTARNAAWRLTDINLHIPFSNIFHNQRSKNAEVVLKGYLDHYNPNFFFSEIVQGKYHAPGVGLLYIWELPVLLYGIHMVANMKGKGKIFLFLWFLFAPVAAAPTHMLPHPVRAMIFLPSLQIFVAIGLREFYVRYVARGKTTGKLILGTGILIIILNFGYYLHQYYIHGPIDNAEDWQYGHEQVVQTVSKIQDKFDKVIVSTSLDQPYIFFLYYLRYDPARYLSYGGTKSGKFDEERNAFDKYEFHKFMKTGPALTPGVLYVGTPSEVLPGAEPLVNISYPSGKTAYVISAEISKKDWNEAGNLPQLK